MNNDDIATIAITRDLARRPEIAHLAKVLQSFVPNQAGTATSPLFIHLAKVIIDDVNRRSNLLTAIEICQKN